ncbi:uncharacterized protein LOC143460887 [Clavelina lepadiformis]|uniref:uncharacterized protein LOC143460887 n=1 Tax=Clavelina lepadiformis TaxID=159417 RepID=UPI004042BDD8
MASTEGKNETENNEEASSHPEESPLDKLNRLIDLVKVKISEGDGELESILRQFFQVNISDQRDNCDKVFDDIIGVIQSLQDLQQYHECLSMLWLAGNLCKTFSKPDIKINRLDECGHLANITAKHMFLDDKKYDIERYTLPMMQHLYEEMKSVETDASAPRAFILCHFFSRLGWCHFFINNYKDAANYFSEGLKTITNMHGDKAKEFLITGACCYEVGECYRLMQKFDDAIEMLEKAIEMYKGAQDVEEEEKRKCIDYCNDRLQKCRARDSVL